MKKAVYILSSENLTQLGGPMGTERTTINWTMVFSSAAAAKSYAQRDYDSRRKKASPIRWHLDRDGDSWHSDDLGFVMYHVKETKVEG